MKLNWRDSTDFVVLGFFAQLAVAVVLLTFLTVSGAASPMVIAAVTTTWGVILVGHIVLQAWSRQ